MLSQIKNTKPIKTKPNLTKLTKPKHAMPNQTDPNRAKPCHIYHTILTQIQRKTIYKADNLKGRHIPVGTSGITGIPNQAGFDLGTAQPQLVFNFFQHKLGPFFICEDPPLSC